MTDTIYNRIVYTNNEGQLPRYFFIDSVVVTSAIPLTDNGVSKGNLAVNQTRRGDFCYVTIPQLTFTGENAVTAVELDALHADYWPGFAQNVPVCVNKNGTDSIARANIGTDGVVTIDNAGNWTGSCTLYRTTLVYRSNYS